MNGEALNPKDSFELVGVDMSNELILHGNVVVLAVATGKLISKRSVLSGGKVT